MHFCSSLHWSVHPLIVVQRPKIHELNILFLLFLCSRYSEYFVEVYVTFMYPPMYHSKVLNYTTNIKITRGWTFIEKWTYISFFFSLSQLLWMRSSSNTMNTSRATNKNLCLPKKFLKYPLGTQSKCDNFVFLFRYFFVFI